MLYSCLQQLLLLDGLEREREREIEREEGLDGWREGWLGGWRERHGRSKKKTETNEIQATAVIRVIVAKNHESTNSTKRRKFHFK
jgi:hypothetical protein